MRRINPLLMMLACWLPCAYAAEGHVTILSPADGATLNTVLKNKIAYEVVPGPAGGHVHLYVDNEETAVLRQRKGEHALDTLSAGKHQICIKLVNKAHTPTGVEQCITVNMK